MSQRRAVHWLPWLKPAVTLGAIGLLAGALAGCSAGNTPSAVAGGGAAAPSFPTPLATSVQTSEGTWATVPMGRLDQPLETFWQLLFRPAGAKSWSDQVEATATATNGGLVLASREGRSLIVGVRPSVRLAFTPLIATSNGARSWSNGLITAGLVARPAALVAGAGGQALALVNEHDGAHVMSSTGDLAAWRTLVSQPVLAGAGPGRACGLRALTAVGYLGGQALIGGSCGRPGVVGLFAERSGAWHLGGPALPRALAQGRVEVLSLGGTAKAETSALLEVSDGTGNSLVVAWAGTSGAWSRSPALPLGAGEKVASVGPATGTGLFVLLDAPSGRDRLMVARISAGWHELTSPPAGTATVAFGEANADALVANGTVLSVWSLAPSSNAWARGQVIRVPIQFGSSQ
jgi:hypothetical protein